MLLEFDPDKTLLLRKGQGTQAFSLSEHLEHPPRTPEAKCKTSSAVMKREHESRSTCNFPRPPVLHIFLHLVSFYICKVFSKKIPPFFPLKPKTPAVKPTASFPAKSTVAGGSGSRQPGPQCSESGLPLGGSLPAKQI